MNSSLILTQIKISSDILEVNGISSISSLMFGIHEFDNVTDLDINELGISAIRYITSDVDSNLLENDRLRAVSVNGHGDHFLIKEHHVPTGIKLIICIGDRYQPAFLLYKKDWEEKLDSFFRSNQNNIIEFWNEPNINWASKPGVNFDVRFYDDRRDAVYLKGKLQNDLVWVTKRKAVCANTGFISYLATRYVNGEYPGLEQEGSNVKSGSVFLWRSRQYICVDTLWVRDITQKNWWAGKQNSKYYNEMFKFASILALKYNITLIGGWGMHLISSDDDVWNTLTKEFIDNNIDKLNIINEHHYGVSPKKVSADYDSVNAYSKTKYNKVLRVFNTESGGAFLIDNRLEVSTSQIKTISSSNVDRNHPGYSLTVEQINQSRYLYLIRDILWVLQDCPDKAYGRMSHRINECDGERFAFRMLKNLRGELIYSYSDHNDVWIVSCMQDGIIYSYIYNDGPDRYINLESDISVDQVLLVRDLNLINMNNSSLLMKRDDLLIVQSAYVKSDKICRKQYYCNDVFINLEANSYALFKINIPEIGIRNFVKINGLYLEGSSIFINGIEKKFDDFQYTCNLMIDNLSRENEIIIKSAKNVKIYSISIITDIVDSIKSKREST